MFSIGVVTLVCSAFRVGEHTTLEKMKAREMKMNLYKYVTTGTFFPSGQIGSWRRAASPALDAKMDDWITRKFSDIDITFSYE